MFQHGLLDSPAAWVSNGHIFSLAYRAYNAGYDVFLGTYRGTADDDLARGPSGRQSGDERHVNLSTSDSEYWYVGTGVRCFVMGMPAVADSLTSLCRLPDSPWLLLRGYRNYSVDDHGLDVFATMQRIYQVKTEEATTGRQQAGGGSHLLVRPLLCA